MLIRVKTELSSFKTLRGDRFGDFLYIFQRIEFLFLSQNVKKIMKSKKLRKCILLAYKILEH